VFLGDSAMREDPRGENRVYLEATKRCLTPSPGTFSGLLLMRIWRTYLLGCWVALSGSGCATPVTGGIPPSAFQFHVIVNHTGPGAGGWQVAQVNVLLGRISRRNPEGTWCDAEVGLPVANWQGTIWDDEAQDLCAESSNMAARFALRQRAATSAALCEVYRIKMRDLLRAQIPGADVTKFKTPGIQPQRFP